MHIPIADHGDSSVSQVATAQALGCTGWSYIKVDTQTRVTRKDGTSTIFSYRAFSKLTVDGRGSSPL